MQSLFPGNTPIVIGISNGTAIVRGKDYVKALKGGIKARLYAVVDGVTVKLNNRNINRTEAELLHKLVSLKLQGQGSKTNSDIYTESGLTVSEYINMLVLTYSDAKAAQLRNPDHNLQIKNNQVIFGDPASGQTLTRDNIAEQKEAFIQWALENKKRRVHGKALGGKLFEKMDFSNKEKITFLGEEYTADSMYDEMLYAGEDAQNHVVNTDVGLVNNRSYYN